MRIRVRQGTRACNYMRARFYDPAIGRFINADPLEGAPTAPQTQNRYAYALNNPTNLVDPRGLSGEGAPGLSCLSFGLVLASSLLLVMPLTPFSVALGIGLLEAAAVIDFARDDHVGLGLDLGSSGASTIFQLFESATTRRFAGHLIFLDLLYTGAGCFDELGVNS